jgi:hypothetical protein
MKDRAHVMVYGDGNFFFYFLPLCPRSLVPNIAKFKNFVKIAISLLLFLFIYYFLDMATLIK